MAARAGFDPVTLWTQGTEPMPEPSLPTISHLFLLWSGAKVYRQTGWGGPWPDSTLDPPLPMHAYV